jgi:hypothetical protein
MTARVANAVIYRERVYPHWAVLLFLGLISISLGIAYGDALGMLGGIVTFALSTAISVLFYRRSSVQIEISSTHLQINAARIEVAYLGEPIHLDSVGTKSARGKNASAQAFIQILSGVSDSVLVPVLDESDPHPYWHFSSRNAPAVIKTLREVQELN